MPADRKSAAYTLKRIELTKKWMDKTAVWSSKEDKLRALDRIKKYVDFIKEPTIALINQRTNEP
jgi:hypothetical protein